jgi:hypothetical protein
MVMETIIKETAAVKPMVVAEMEEIHIGTWDVRNDFAPTLPFLFMVSSREEKILERARKRITSTLSLQQTESSLLEIPLELTMQPPPPARNVLFLTMIMATRTRATKTITNSSTQTPKVILLDAHQTDSSSWQPFRELIATVFITSRLLIR